MKTIAFVFAVLSFGTLFVGCGQSSDRVDSQSKVIIGANDLRYYNNENLLSKSIGIMPNIGCTATHIGQGLVITAGHCVTSTSCSATYDVLWTFTQRNSRGAGRSRCLRVLAQEENSQRDYAVMLVDNPPSASLATNLGDRPSQGDRLTILSHPAGRPLSWSGWCAHEGEFSGNRFAYACDTEGGSSGAAVLNERLEVVGIHNLGSSASEVNAGTYLQDIPYFQRLR
jgi:V8-like Glu-specific endopeptidase